MNEERIRELLDRLFSLKYQSEYGSHMLPVISRTHQQQVSQVVRQWALENHDEQVGTLEAKVFVYENIIRNSNFAPMIHIGNESGGNGFMDETGIKLTGGMTGDNRTSG